MPDPFKAKGNPAISVYVLRIRHRHGENVYVNHTEDGANAELYAYVRENWDEGITEQYGDLETLTQEQAIESYFDCLDKALDPEYYEIEQVTVGR